MKSLTDEELMIEVSKGHLDTMSILFERYHVGVFNFLFRMCGERALSEDLTQEVFYKLIKYRSSYKGGKFASWIFTIARNSLSNHYRKQKETADIDTVLYKLTEEEEEPKEEVSHLKMVLEKLSPKDKELVVLNKLQGIRYEELAEIVGSSPGAVKVKVHRALKKLKQFYFQTTQNGL